MERRGKEKKRMMVSAVGERKEKKNKKKKGKEKNEKCGVLALLCSIKTRGTPLL
jgi:hypothetical protein